MVVIQTIPTIALAPYPGSLVWLWYASKTGFDHYYGGISHRSQSVRWFSALRSRYSEIVSDYASQSLSDLVHYKILRLPYFFRRFTCGVSYAFISTVVSEWLGGFDGLGVYMIPVEEGASMIRCLRSLY